MLPLRPKSPLQYTPAFFRALMVAGLALCLPASAADGVAVVDSSGGIAAGDSAAVKEAPQAAPAGEAAKKSPASEKMLESILSKEGITLAGAFRSRFLHSSIGGPGIPSTLRSEESLEYTSVDFDIRARPNTATQGRLIIRMHQDWRNFFSDIGNPINTRWISLDGKIKEMFSYNVGDFRQRYSSLTLYAPELDVMYEPGIFAGNRREAMDEAFLGNSDRLLQGVNLNFDASVDRGTDGALLREFHVNVLGSRLRNVETSIQNGGKPTSMVERSPAEKFLAAGNTDLTFPFGMSLGGSYLRIFDKKGSYAASAGSPDTGAQKTDIFAGRLGYDMATLLDGKDWNVGFSAEYAQSVDDSSFFVPDTGKTSIKGAALLGRVYGEWKTGKAFGLRLGLDYIKNEADYRNELAQTPTFIGERIMNIENDSTAVGKRTNDVRAMNYSTFDAMYQHAFKFAPSLATNMWARAPFSKNSYTHQIMTQGELAAFSALRADTALQLVMPFGPATPNRTGIRTDATFSFWEDRIEVQALFAALENVEGVRVDTARSWSVTKFSQMGGGLKLEIGSMLGLALPLTLSGSLVRSDAKNDGVPGDTTVALSPIKVTSDFVNAGLRYSFWKRFSLLGGYQQIVNTVTRAAETKQTQTHIAGGLDYKVAAGAHLMASVGQVKVDNPVRSVETDFSQLQTDLFLTVHF